MLTIILISLKYFKIYVEITRCPLQTYMYLLDKEATLRYELSETKIV